MQSPADDRTPSPHDHVWHPPSAISMETRTSEILGPFIRTGNAQEEFMLHDQDSFFDCEMVNVHYQLRKTVVCVGNVAYFTTSTGVHSYNFLTHKLFEVLSTTKPITSLSASKQYLVVGGPLGSLILFDLLKAEVVWEGTIKGSTLNAFSFHYTFAMAAPLPTEEKTDESTEPEVESDEAPIAGETAEVKTAGNAVERVFAHETRLVVANNNPRYGVQIFALPMMTPTTSLVCPQVRDRTPIGGVQVSPNQKWIVAVGDNQQVFLIRYHKDVEKKGGRTGLYTLEKSIDVCAVLVHQSNTKVPGNCFDCSWTPTSNMFAVSCEAGYVILFNLNGQIIHSYRAFDLDSGSVYNRSRDLISSVKFSPDISRPLLAFFQPYKHLTVLSYDPCDLTGEFFATRQNLIVSQLPGCKKYESIVGIDWTHDGSLVAGLQWSDPKDKFLTPKPVRTANTSTPLGRLCIFRDSQQKSLQQLCTRFVQQNIEYFLEHKLEELRLLPLDLQELVYDNLDELQQEIAV